MGDMQLGQATAAATEKILWRVQASLQFVHRWCQSRWRGTARCLSAQQIRPAQCMVLPVQASRN